MAVKRWFVMLAGRKMEVMLPESIKWEFKGQFLYALLSLNKILIGLANIREGRRKKKSL